MDDNLKPATSKKGMSRRTALGAIVVGGAVAAGGIYAATRFPYGIGPNQPTTETTSSNQYEPTVELRTNPQYVAALEGQSVGIDGKLFDQDKVNLDYTLTVNGQTVSKGKASYKSDLNGYTELLYTTKPGDLNIGKNTTLLMASDGVHSVHDGRELYVDKKVEFQEEELKVPIKGIMYDTDIPALYQEPFTHEQMVEHLTAIRQQLCDSARIVGDDIDLMYDAGKIAIGLDFRHIMISPFWANETPTSYLQRMPELVSKCNELKSISDAVYLNIVEEPSLTVRGILDDNPWWVVRAGKIGEKYRVAGWRGKLKIFIDNLIPVARKFNGDILVGIGMWEHKPPNNIIADWEGLDWRDFDLDITGYSHCWYPEYGDWSDPNNYYIQRIKLLKEMGRPVHITEFGAITTSNAWDLGGAGFEKKGPYDEDMQAECIERYKKMFNVVNNDSINLDACFLLEFCDNEPTSSQDEYGIMRVIDTSVPPEKIVLERKKAAFKYASLKNK